MRVSCMAATCSQCSKKCLHVFVYIVLDVRKYIGQAGERSKFKDFKKIHKFQKFQVKRTRNLQIKFTLKLILSEKTFDSPSVDSMAINPLNGL